MKSVLIWTGIADPACTVTLKSKQDMADPTDVDSHLSAYPVGVTGTIWRSRTMALSAQIYRNQFQRVLKGIEQRNDAIELFAADAEIEEGSTSPSHAGSLKVRVMSVRDDALIVERPMARPGMLRLSPGMELAGQIRDDATMWRFLTEVRKSAKHQLNRSTHVPAIVLSAPHDATIIQQRAYYRVSSASSTVSSAQLWPIPDEMFTPTAEEPLGGHPLANVPDPDMDVPHPGTGPPVWVSLINISGGGASILVETGLPFVRFWMSLDLGDPEGRLWVIGRIVHVQDCNLLNQRLGVEFDYTHHPLHRRTIEDVLCRFAAAEQRRQLQRVRGVGSSFE